MDHPADQSLQGRVESDKQNCLRSVAFSSHGFSSLSPSLWCSWFGSQHPDVLSLRWFLGMDLRKRDKEAPDSFAPGLKLKYS